MKKQAVALTAVQKRIVARLITPPTGWRCAGHDLQALGTKRVSVNRPPFGSFEVETAAVQLGVMFKRGKRESDYQIWQVGARGGLKWLRSKMSL